MAKIKICDLCKKPMDRYLPINNRHYSLKRAGLKMDICGECMEKFLEWIGLSSQANGIPPMPKNVKPPKDGNVAQKN